MGFFDSLFGNKNQIPTVTSILPDAARQEIIAGRLPILNTDKLFLKKGEKIHFIDKAVNMEQKKVKNSGIPVEVLRDYSKEQDGAPGAEKRSSTLNWCSTGAFYM